MTDCLCHSHSGFLIRRGYALVAQQLSLEGLAPRGECEYFDKVGSVSALIEIENDFAYDPTHIELNRREIYNGV